MRSDIQSSSCYLLSAAHRKAHDLDPCGAARLQEPAAVSAKLKEGRASERESTWITPLLFLSRSSVWNASARRRCLILNWSVPFYSYSHSKKKSPGSFVFGGGSPRGRTLEWQRTLSAPPTELRSANRVVKAVGLFRLICGEICISWIFHLPTCCYVEEWNALLSPLTFIYCQNSVLPTT